MLLFFFLYCVFFQAEDGIRDLVRSRGLGDVYKRQSMNRAWVCSEPSNSTVPRSMRNRPTACMLLSLCTNVRGWRCLLYTSDAADERSSVDLGGRRII